jgi:hypothetical protein
LERHAFAADFETADDFAHALDGLREEYFIDARLAEEIGAAADGEHPSEAGDATVIAPAPEDPDEDHPVTKVRLGDEEGSVRFFV